MFPPPISGPEICEFESESEPAVGSCLISRSPWSLLCPVRPSFEARILWIDHPLSFKEHTEPLVIIKVFFCVGGGSEKARMAECYHPSRSSSRAPKNAEEARAHCFTAPDAISGAAGRGRSICSPEGFDLESHPWYEKKKTRFNPVPLRKNLPKDDNQKAASHVT